MYFQDIFYNVRDFSNEEVEKIFRWAFERSFEYKTDALGLDGTWIQRKLTDLDFETTVEQWKKSKWKHDTIIHRRGYEDWKDNEFFRHRWSLEVGSRYSYNGFDYFIWIHCDEKYVSEIIEEFNLKELS